MKFKKIPKEYFTKILDRLTRFEPAHIRYKRVFDDIINKFCLDYKLKELDLKSQIEIVQEIFNSSVSIKKDDTILPLMYGLEDKYFYPNEVSYQYLSARLNISSMLSEIEENENLPKNLIWLKQISDYSDLKALREEKSLLYPIEKVLLCEGETERILLGLLLKFFNIDLNKKGIILIPAGGKNQVARKFYSMIENTKLPFFILLDKDAISTKELIDKRLRTQDRVYIINSGEFEDLIPSKILENTINYVHKNELHCLKNDFEPDKTSVHNIENIYKKYGFGEFKKSQFAQELKEYIEKNCTINDFKSSEITDIANALN